MEVIMIGAIIVILVTWLILVRRRLVIMNENINNAMSQIGVQLSSRFNALSVLLDLIKEYADGESKILIESIKSQKSHITAASAPEDVRKQEGIILEALEYISIVVKQYPELETNENYIKCKNAIDSYEKMVHISRLIYNDSVTKLNRELRMFPISLLAVMFGFRQREYLEIVEEKANMKTKLLSQFLVLTMMVSLTACGGEEATDTVGAASIEENVTNNDAVADASDTGDGSWAVYWYLCGSDLESNGGFATMDLSEMMEVTLPENVNVVIQTGGATVWQNEYMDPAKLQRWVYNSEGLQLVDEQETANMGEAQTLYEFLSFANENYPADKVAVTFWNHGGGSVSGAAFDEIYGLDSLDLAEMYQAFDAVWPADASNPALELVGFDTCLMATVDVAAVFQDFAKYLVASEEVEPGNGWLYSGWLGELAANPAMKGDELGVAICDTYYKGCEAVGTQDQTTLSVTDLTKLTPLLEAYESLGEEMFVAAAEDPGFFAELGRAASQSENYGGNTREQGYTNMLDLGHLARQTAWMLPSAQSVSDALDECIIYKVGGVYRSEATGLSCYYSYNGDIDDFNGYINVGAGIAFKHLYAYGLTGEMAEGGDEYLASLDIQELPEIVTLADMDWDGAPLDVDDEGTSFLTLGPDAADVLAGIGFQLFYVDESNDQMMLLGTDNDMTADWDNGVFYDNFRGVWGAIDGHLVYMELSFEGEDYNLYSVPILLNDEEYNLQVAYDFTAEQWSILGASQGLDESGMASKEMRLLEEGDVITTIWKLASYSGEDDFEMYTVEELTVTADTSFSEAALPDGSYSMVIEMWDAAGNYAYSDAVTFDCANGEIMTTVYED